MKRLTYFIIIILLITGSVFLFSAQDQPAPPPGQAQQSGQQAQSSEPVFDRYGYVAEMVYAWKVHAFVPKTYSTVYLRPAGEGTIDTVAVVTYRPRQLVFLGELSELGAKFTTLFPTVHFVYVSKSGTGSTMQIDYKPSSGAASLSQDARYKMAFDYAREDDRNYYEAIKKWEEERARRRSARENQATNQPGR